jgi:hypothetical protein
MPKNRQANLSVIDPDEILGPDLVLQQDTEIPEHCVTLHEIFCELAKGNTSSKIRLAKP